MIALLATILAAAAGSVLAMEFTSTAPMCSRAMTRLAIRMIPTHRRDWYREQWASDLAARREDGQRLVLLFVALGFLVSGLRVRVRDRGPVAEPRAASTRPATRTVFVIQTKDTNRTWTKHDVIDWVEMRSSDEVSKPDQRNQPGSWRAQDGIDWVELDDPNEN